MRSVELFAGGGGLALGTHLAGFSTELVAEWDARSCQTLRDNYAANDSKQAFTQVKVCEGDVRDIDWSGVAPGVDLVSGGPPCQPFSLGGKAMAAEDPRDMFPATAEVIRQLQPRAFMIENVRGLTRAAFTNYFSYIQLRLAHPDITPRQGESWADHHGRLQAEHTSAHTDLQYKVVTQLVNAADYGVPQQRWRVFLWALGATSTLSGLSPHLLTQVLHCVQFRNRENTGIVIVSQNHSRKLRSETVEIRSCCRG